jgi:hypothetical protein
MNRIRFNFKRIKDKTGICSKSFWWILMGWLILMGSSCQSEPDRSIDKKDTIEQKKFANKSDSVASQATVKQDKVADTIDISPYKKQIPPFKIRLVDGKGYTYKDLKMDCPLILVYFQPDCPECQAFTAALVKRLPSLMDKQIVMITFEDIKKVKAFDEKYQVSGHPNVRIGSEGYTFIVQKYYQIEHFPIVACFNNKGELQRIINPKLAPEAMAALL